MIYVIAVSVAILLALVCLTAQHESLPSVALVMYAFLPVGYSTAPAVFTILSPACVVMSIFVAVELSRNGRRGLAHQSRQGALAQFGAASVGLFVLWLIIKTFDSESMERALAWSAAFGLLVLLPLLVVMSPSTTFRLKKTWVLVGALLGVYGMLESSIGLNPMYGWVYDSAPFPIHQYWSSYRITTSLGHPLWNALFLAVSASMGVGRFVETGRYRWLGMSALSGMGVFLTVSRGGVIALTLATLFVCLAGVFLAPLATVYSIRSSGGTRTRSTHLSRAVVILAVGAVAVFAVLESRAFQERALSSNGVASSAARSDLIPLALEVSERQNHLGSGAGNSSISVYDAAQELVVENSYFQLLVSLGIPGLFLFITVISTAMLAALRARSLAVTGGLVAYSVAIGGFNWLEANRAGLFLLGLLLALAWSDFTQRMIPRSCTPGQGLLTTDYNVLRKRKTVTRLALGPRNVHTDSSRVAELTRSTRALEQGPPTPTEPGSLHPSVDYGTPSTKGADR